MINAHRIHTYVDSILAHCGEKTDILSILMAGSILRKPLDQCLDLDFVLLSNDSNIEGVQYFEEDGIRYEVHIVPVSGYMESIMRGIRSQNVMIAQMIIDGEPIYGIERGEVYAVKKKVQEYMATARPFYFREIAGFVAQGLLLGLSRAQSRGQVAQIAIGIVEFIAKNQGPINGAWPQPIKCVLDEIELLEGTGDGSLLQALHKCFGGDKSELISYFSRWLESYAIERGSKFFVPIYNR
jgi:hypothetical protein